jgi:hypothetical protein
LNWSAVRGGGGEGSGPRSPPCSLRRAGALSWRPWLLDDLVQARCLGICRARSMESGLWKPLLKGAAAALYATREWSRENKHLALILFLPSIVSTLFPVSVMIFSYWTNLL